MRHSTTTALAIATFLTFTTFLPLSAAAKEPLAPQTGEAACYSPRLTGHRTTSGQRYNPNALTAAHGTIPLGSHVKVTNLENGKSVVVLVNDHMSSRGKIIMDISRRACNELQFGPGGEAKVKLEVEPSNGAAASP
jgi:rare lipoprotein A